MKIADNEIKLFVHADILRLQNGFDEMRKCLLSNNVFLNHSFIKLGENGLEVIKPTIAQQKYSLTDVCFQYFVEQKVMDGYIYCTLDSLKKIAAV